ncbi:MAG: hypothetical protein U9O59_01730 [Actinomycetota bacterium]|nr:hypothetical protein [Actinomycetota bacterium]
MKKEKAIAIMAWYKESLVKFAVILLAASLIFMVTSCSRAAGAGEAEYPPPQNLSITGFTGSGADRTVNLTWDEPDTEEEIIEYIVYRDDGELSRTDTTNYQDVIGDINYDFYITAIYKDGIESGPGNIVNTGNPADMPPVGPGDTGEEDQEDDGDSGLSGDDDKDTDSQAFNWDEVLSGPCGNPYYPVVMGASYTYNSSNAGSYTSTITSVSEDGFTVTHTIGGSTQTHEWECLPEGLVDFSNPAGDALKVIGEGATITGTSNVTGITIPSSISVGDSWSQTYSGTLTVQGFDTDLDFSTTVNYTAIGKETVTVAAGTFEAIRVASSLKSDFILKTHGTTMPLYTYESTSSAWFAENIGSVRSATQGLIKGLGYMEGQLSQEFSDTTELVEFSLP